jgi:hypothetical protein
MRRYIQREGEGDEVNNERITMRYTHSDKWYCGLACNWIRGVRKRGWRRYDDDYQDKSKNRGEWIPLLMLLQTMATPF